MNRHSNMRPDINTVNSKRKDSKPSTPNRQPHRSKERQSTEKLIHSNQHYLKESLVNKQQNLPPDIISPINLMQYSPSNECHMVTATNTPKQRSKSTVCDRQPWRQLLSKHSGLKHESLFGKCDPLRTLHFLARELLTHVQAQLPEETDLLEIVKAMHSALKRIPPEVASTVQLQQHALDLLPKLKRNVADPKLINCDNLDEQSLQAHKEPLGNDYGEIQKLIEGSTMKLEATCKHLDDMCGQLRDEHKVSLEAMLQSERANSKVLQRKIAEMEYSNNRLSNDLSQKDVELAQLKSAIGILESRLHEKNSCSTDVQSTIGELKKSKLLLEQDVSKLEHQLRVCAIEKEKYLAILAVRDKQIYEIRNEMTQLQQSVNEQLVELHNYAVGSLPTNIAGQIGTQDQINPEVVDTISSIWAEDDNKSDHSLKDLYSDDDKQQPTRDMFHGVG